MGLRISTNVPSLVALRNLNRTDARQQTTFERLSTGLRINHAADDPTGIALSENIRAQVEGLSQAVDNTRSASNLLSTAETALSQISDILVSVRKSIVFAMDGTATREQVAAEQDAVNASIDAIDRIANSSRYGDVRLLNGSSSYTIESVSSSGILEVNPTSVRFNPVSGVTNFDVAVLQVALQARARASTNSLPATVAASGGDVILQITGPLGTEMIRLASGAVTTDVTDAVNAVRGFTGIYASGGYLITENFGTGATMRLVQIDGTGRFTGGDIVTPGLSGTGSIYSTEGQDASINFEGTIVSGSGNNIHVNTPFFSGEIVLNPVANEDPLRGPGSVGQFGFSIRRSGLLFQLGGEAGALNQSSIGIMNSSAAYLGSPTVIIGGIESGGYLNTIVTGQGNDMTANPDNAFWIASSALEDINTVRSLIGSFIADVLEPTSQAHDVAIENLRASDSDIRDADFAEEVAAMTRNQVLFQAGISVLAQANSVPRNVLQLLQ